MNYEDMQGLKKGDVVKVYTGNGWLSGEVVGSESGSSPAIYVATSEDKATKVYTGANFTKDSWYKLKHHNWIQFANQEQEDFSMEWVRGQ